MGSGRGGELSAVLNSAGQAAQSGVDQVVAPTRILDRNFCPSTAGAALLPAIFKENLKEKVSVFRKTPL